jgi:uncharacterized spore protein YtfJ
MEANDILRSIGETIGVGATVKSVYGEPVTIGERTVIPIARIKYAFGGGGGSGHGSDASSRGMGGGGGGGLTAAPWGVIEITPSGTRFIAFQDPGAIAIAVAAGAVLGFLACRLIRRST